MKQMIHAGIYPMLYSFFDESGGLRLDPFQAQVDAALNCDVAGLAILGLGTEVSRLTPEERVQVLETVAKRINGKVPLLVTIYGDTPSEQIEFANRAIDSGATALLLQPPAQHIDDQRLVGFFSEVIEAAGCPIGIQNAPEFLGYGLSNESLIRLAREHQNFSIAKLECTAVALKPIADALSENVMVFNGRCGLELPDNLRAGAEGLIPGFEAVDKTSEIYATFTSGDEEGADELYTELSPIISFVMQRIPHYLTYGKLLAALRLDLELGGTREPSHVPTEFGAACTRRFAGRLGQLRR